MNGRVLDHLRATLALLHDLLAAAAYEAATVLRHERTLDTCFDCLANHDGYTSLMFSLCL
jgi:hypothetical protein